MKEMINNLNNVLLVKPIQVFKKYEVDNKEDLNVRDYPSFKSQLCKEKPKQ